MSTSITEKIRNKYGSVAHYARSHGFPTKAIYRVISGEMGKLESPLTLSGRIISSLRNDGLWPEGAEEKR